MRQDVYRVAYDQANAELTEILSKFEQLRARKDRIEKVVDVLKPLVASELQSAPGESLTGYAPMQPEPQPQPQQIPQQMQSPVQPHQSIMDEAPQMVPDQSAPMRRTDSGFGSSVAPARDVREYSRLFSNGQTR